MGPKTPQKVASYFKILFAETVSIEFGCLAFAILAMVSSWIVLI